MMPADKRQARTIPFRDAAASKFFEDESASNTIRGRGTDDHAGSPFHNAGVADPVERLADWYDNLPHMSLKNGKEMSAEAYVCKQAPEGTAEKEMGGRTCMLGFRRNYLSDITHSRLCTYQ